MSKQKPLEWTLNLAERQLVARIVERYMKAKLPGTTKGDRQTITMDLTACHLNAVPLNLERMADWPRDFDVFHDIAGINRHLDRTTGALRDCFVPRFALGFVKQGRCPAVSPESGRRCTRKANHPASVHRNGREQWPV